MTAAHQPARQRHHGRVLAPGSRAWTCVSPSTSPADRGSRHQASPATPIVPGVRHRRAERAQYCSRIQPACAANAPGKSRAKLRRQGRGQRGNEHKPAIPDRLRDARESPVVARRILEQRLTRPEHWDRGIEPAISPAAALASPAAASRASGNAAQAEAAAPDARYSASARRRRFRSGRWRGSSPASGMPVKVTGCPQDTHCTGASRCAASHPTTGSMPTSGYSKTSGVASTIALRHAGLDGRPWTKRSHNPAASSVTP